jgi:hypothetical protein
VKKNILIILISLCLCSCAKVDVISDPNGVTEWHSFTVLKDISVDPNGVASTTSSSADSILGTVFGFLAAWIVK